MTSELPILVRPHLDEPGQDASSGVGQGAQSAVVAPESITSENNVSLDADAHNVLLDADTHRQLEELLSRGREQMYTDPKGALELARYGLELARVLHEPSLLADALQLHAICQYHLTSYAHALSSLLEVIPLLESLERPLDLARSLNTLALVSLELGDYDDALRDFERSHQIFRQLGHVSGEATTIGNIALAYDRMGQPEKALEFNHQSLKLREEQSDWHGVGQAMNNLSGLHIEMGERHQHSGASAAARHEFETAVNLATHALQLARKLEDTRLEAMVLNNLASVHAATHQAAEAREDYLHSLSLARQIGDRQLEAACLADLGRLDHHNNQHRDAISHLETALELFQLLGSKNQLSGVHRDLSSVYEAIGEPAWALTHFKRHHDIAMALRTETSERRSQSLAARFELSRIRHESDLHRTHARELAHLNQQLQEQARLLDLHAREDALTGLANRRVLEEVLERSFRTAQTEGGVLSVVYADVDNFKLVNDRFSHAVGDAVLRQVAQLLVAHSRDHDLVARYGGEEFVLVLPGVPGPQAFEICERLRLIVLNHDWSSIHPDLRLTMSFGYADDIRLQNHERLLAAADEYLYMAKHAGRNQVRPRPG
jgi:diguanylate cyclase (GGDEF)-like protein